MRIRCGIAAMALLLPVAILAAPPLSTIEDVLYKADGSRFNGIAFIEWKSFQAADFSNIATHSVTVTILNGVIRVQLVPTTDASPGAYYSVRYNSDGRIQFDEIWAVPPSTATLKLKDVRVAAPSAGGQVDPPPSQTVIQESDVVGLVDDLAIRPLKGPGFAPSRAAYISDTGTLEAVEGSLADCVRVDGTAGPCDLEASAGPAFVDAEAPAGLIDGTNTTFTLASIPGPPSSLALYRNGVLQKEGVDYILTDNVISFAQESVPQPDDILVCSYRLSSAANPGGQAVWHDPGWTSDPSPSINGDVWYNVTDQVRRTVEANQIHALSQVICSSTGSSTSSTSLTRLGSCTLPANFLKPGDRVDVRFSYSHEGTARGFTFEIHWGSTTALSRAGGSSDSRVAGYLDFGLHSGGAQWNVQSWGSALALASGSGNAGDSFASPLVIDLLGKMASSTTNTITLRNFTVTRYPAQANP